MKYLFLSATFLLMTMIFTVQPAFGQAECVFSVNPVNHNRYVYSSDEECGFVWPFEHSVPFGVWGINSNVGSRQNADQFKGWAKPCSDLRVDWNSCANEYVKPDLNCSRLNFPDQAGLYPYPANGYPFTDSYSWNDNVPLAGGTATCVDQFSPCGANVYGSTGVRVGVSAVVDYDGDYIPDAGGCKDLDGYVIRVQDNHMTAYEMDWNGDDIVGKLYFPNIEVTLRCTPDACFAVGDNNYDGWADDVNNQFSSEYKWPILYEDDYGRISYPSTPGVPFKRIDATIRIGRMSAYYSGPYPNPYPEPDPDPCMQPQDPRMEMQPCYVY